MLGIYHTSSLLDILADLHHIHEEPQLYQFALNRCSEVLRAQGGTFYVVREDLGELYPVSCKGVSLNLLKEIPFKMKSGICGWVATERKPVVVENAQEDERFNRAIDVITGIRTRSVLAVPILREDRIMGVLELMNRIDGVFSDKDLGFVTHFSNQLAVALENCRLYRQTEELLIYTNSVINSLTGGFISTNKRGKVTRFNDAAVRILGIKKSDVVGKLISEALSQYPAFGAILDVTQKHETPANRQEIELSKPDGTNMKIGYSTFLIRDENKKNYGAGIIFQDLTRLLHK